jgi:hypothetical protein
MHEALRQVTTETAVLKELDGVLRLELQSRLHPHQKMKQHVQLLAVREILPTTPKLESVAI